MTKTGKHPTNIAGTHKTNIAGEWRKGDLICYKENYLSFVYEIITPCKMHPKGKICLRDKQGYYDYMNPQIKNNSNYINITEMQRALGRA
jgi:hypothetical protein